MSFEEALIRAGFETLLLTLFVLIICKSTNIVYFFRSLGQGFRSVLSSFLILLMFVHLIDRWQYDYPLNSISAVPFVRFAMYQAYDSRAASETYAWRVTDEDSVEFVNMFDYFNAVGGPSLTTRMNSLSKGLRGGRPESRMEVELWAEELRARTNSGPCASIEFLLLKIDRVETVEQSLFELSPSELGCAR